MARKQLLKHLSVYGLGGVLTNAISYFLLPLYTRVLTPVDYGTLTLINIAGAVVSAIVGLMVSSGFIRVYYDDADDNARAELFGTAVWFTLGCGVLMSGSMAFLAEPLANAVFEFGQGETYLLLVTVSMSLFATSFVLYGLLMVQERSRLYITINLLTITLMLTLTVIFVVVLDWSVLGVFRAQVIGRAVELLILLTLLLRRGYLRFSFNALGRMLYISGPLIPAQLCFLALTLADRFFLQGYKDLTEVGLYSLGYKLAAVMPILIVQPLKAWGPYIYSLKDSPEACRAAIVKMLRFYVAGVVLLALMISVYSREILMVMADYEFWGAWQVVYVLCAGYMLYGIMNVIAYGFHIVKKTWVLSIIIVSGSGLNIGLNFLMVPAHGMMGASIASALSYVFIILLYFICLKYVYPVRFQYGRMLAAIGAGGLFYWLATLREFDFAVSVPLKTVCVLGAVAVLWWSGYFSADDKALLRGGLQSALRKLGLRSV
ncbi:MAG: oligosaccharide flippase family protein [candidate division Zixibacteria bacterium]|nr:oligosaccharide flippase family protein [candidate division Zixibacteria bacterium]